MGAAFLRFAMDGLHTMDKQDYLEQMQADVQRILARVADAVNGAASGNVINGSEMEVLAAMTELKELAFQKAVQMRVDSTESTFFPGGPVGAAEAEQRADGVDDPERQRADSAAATAVSKRRWKK
jgi:hypothetical protein